MKSSLTDIFLKDQTGNMQIFEKLCHAFTNTTESALDSEELEHSCILIGSIKVLKAIFTKNVEIKHSMKAKVHTILKKLLFGGEKEPRLQAAKLKSQEMRLQAIELMVQINGNENCAYDLLKYLLPLHADPLWRSFAVSDWNITPQKEEKPISGYVGLRNLGFTCYLNSLLQQLYMIPQLRNQIISLDYEDRDPNTNALIQLQQVFASLDDKEYSSYGPKGFCNSMAVEFGRQQDVYDFMTILFERLQEEMKNTRLKNLIKEFFEFKTVTEITCTKCNRKKQKPETSLILALDVRGKKNIIESLRSFTNQETLQGDNAYECSYCREKVTANKKDILSRLPNQLIICLKRFEKMFGADGFVCQKVNSYCEFPADLDLREFTATDGRVGMWPEDFFKYKLRGIIVHMGQLEGGHYYSFIEDREKKEMPAELRWFEFNDARVTPFNPKDIPDAAYGDLGDKKGAHDPDIPPELLMKENNAYILFYERNIFVPEEVLSVLDDETSTMNNDETFEELMRKRERDRLGIKRQLSSGVQKKMNIEKDLACSRNYLLCADYSKLLAYCIRNLFVIQEKKGEEVTESFKKLNDEFLVKYIFTTGLRTKLCPEIKFLIDQLRNSVAVNHLLARKIVEMFSCKSMIEEFILRCPSIDSRKAVVSILKAAIACIASEESEEFAKFILSCAFSDQKKLIETISSGNPEWAEKFPPSAIGNSLVISLPHELNIMKKASKPIIPQLFLLADALIQQLKQFKQYSSNAPQLQLFQILSAIIVNSSPSSENSEVPVYYIQSHLPFVILDLLEVAPSNGSAEYISDKLPHIKYSNDQLIVPEMRAKYEPDTAKKTKEDISSGLLEIYSLLIKDISLRVYIKEAQSSQSKTEEEKFVENLKKGVDSLATEKYLNLLMKFGMNNNGSSLKYVNNALIRLIVFK